MTLSANISHTMHTYQLTTSIIIRKISLIGIACFTSIGLDCAVFYVPANTV